ncbi:MAG: flagellar biosynthesis protein FlhA [Usitatibacteraceae bacterium]
MNAVLERLNLSYTPWKALAAPILMMMILGMMVLPLPAFALDMLFTFNIALSLVVLLVAVYTRKPLEFAAFPTVLLVTTLLRLSLNVASTRVVLLNGHTGGDAAGKLIEAFAHFLIGGNFAVGIIVFAILVVINFMVVTKGAGRIAEVSARFTLDAMPGKQMAIDADLNAGTIDQAEAKKRRAEISQEAEFFGSMDGASKFVRGDAIAGILILFINIIGGLIIGMAQHNLSVAQAANNYILLAIGDGLVAQIPSLVISVAAALIVARVGNDQDIGTQISTQLFTIPRSLGLTSAVMFIIGVIPGMPHIAFLMMAGALGYGAWWLTERSKLAKAAPVEAAPEPVNVEASWDDLQPVDIVGLEVGYRLIPLVDPGQDGELLKRIKAIRKKFAQDVGFLPSAVHIRDNLELKPNAYRITLKGVSVGEGEAISGMLLAINPGEANAPLTGTATRDPAFGLPATWIEASQREFAQTQGYTVVDAPTVVATHLSHLMHTQAAQLLGRQETQALMDHVNKYAPKLLDDIVPKLISIAAFQKVLQNLLEEGVHIRDLRTILEAIAETASQTQSTADITNAVRARLGRAIVQKIYGQTTELDIIALDPEIERMLGQALSVNASDALAIEPGLGDMIVARTAEAAERQEGLGLPAVLLVPDRLRTQIARLMKRAAPRLKVLGHGEIPDFSAVRVSAIVGAQA